MKEHNWHEHRFEVDGELNGFRCSVQEYKCRNCGVIIELPMGVKPNDYPSEECKASNKANSKPLYVPRVPESHRMHAGNINNGNRHEVRRMRADSAMRSAEKA